MPELDLPNPKDDEGGSRKRKAKVYGPKASERKRIKRFYNDEYRELYNSVVSGHFHSPSAVQNQFLSPSQLGSSVWTVAEKSTFFHFLSRKGRHDLRAIAVKIGSKSEVEVGQYIEVLHRGLTDAELLHTRPQFTKRPEFEAAAEISPECVAALDLAGHALSLFQEEQDVKVEQEKQGTMWLLTPKIGDWVEGCLQGKKGNEDEVSQLVPEAILLNLKCFLWLSKSFFMNSSDLEYNWSSYAEKSKPPAILRTAFTDFHTLALSTTRRLVQSTLHFAMSRLRAEQHIPGQHPKIVKRRDVATALQALEMGGSMKSYWSGVPRRCNLGVLRGERENHLIGETYSHDEVEVLLASHRRIANGEVLPVSLGDDEVMEDNDSARSDFRPSSSTDSEPDDTDKLDPCEETPLSDQDRETVDAQKYQEQHRDEALEQLDRKESQAEVKYLWQLLDKDIAVAEDAASGNGNLRNLLVVRKTKAELVDWTSWVDYSAEWETLKSTLPIEKSTQ